MKKKKYSIDPIMAHSFINTELEYDRMIERLSRRPFFSWGDILQGHINYFIVKKQETRADLLRVIYTKYPELKKETFNITETGKITLTNK